VNGSNPDETCLSPISICVHLWLQLHRDGLGAFGPQIMNELIFLVEEPSEGGFIARALGESIFTEAETLDELRQQVRDAVRCHFDKGKAPKVIRLHFVREEVLAG
jgi:hypothetical protein